MASENTFLLYALLMGVFVTFVYDILRIARRLFPHGSFLVSLEDLCFWIYCGAEVFLLMNRLSDGTLRWFAVLGAAVGVLLYKKLVSPWLVKYSSLILGKALEIVTKFLSFLFRPLRLLLRRLRKVLRRASEASARRRQKNRAAFKKKLTYLLKMIKMSL